MNWLLLRGLVRERRHWAGFASELAARTGGEVLALDLPGVGTERDRVSPTTIGGIVEDLRARFLIAASSSPAPGPWAIFAPSLGGMIAMAWAERFPSDFAHVAVCNTSTRDLGSLLQRFSPEALRTVALSLVANGVAPDPLARERRTLALVCNTAHGRAHAESFASFGRSAPIGVGVLVRQLLAASGADAPQALAVPLTVLCSEGDRLCSPAVSRALAARFGATLFVHPDGGHDLPLDDAPWVLDVLGRVTGV